MSNNVTESFSSRIKTALSVRRMKQTELCEKTKIPKSALSEYIKGAYEPKQDRVFLMAEALDVDPAWLMGFDVPMSPARTISPSEPALTEGETELLGLFRRIPESQQQLVLQMIRAALATL